MCRAFQGSTICCHCSRKFLSEFLEVGGLLTVLEVLAVKKASEEDRMEALDLLINLAKTGRQCKELICESYGIKSVAESLAQSSSPHTQQKAQHLLLLLFQVELTECSTATVWCAITMQGMISGYNTTAECQLIQWFA